SFLYIFFFFSSRRRHTRSDRDWSSDVCSSDLPNIVGGSADLNPSTNTALKGGGDFQPTGSPDGAQGAVGGGWGYSGRNMAFGVRSEERRVGKECRSRWSAEHEKKKRVRMDDVI